MTDTTTTDPYALLAERGVSPARLLFADLDDELASTRRLLERYPDEHADWRPHEKSGTLANLAAHVAQLPNFGVTIAEQPELDMMARPFVPPTARTREEMLALFDGHAARAKRAIEGLDYDALDVTWKLRAGERVFVSGKRGYLLRRMLISHIAHHRGQLTIYYRLLGVPVPGMYGPSADDRAEAGA
jgi:uncharacterized damage-inducible protein DinB